MTGFDWRWAEEKSTNCISLTNDGINHRPKNIFWNTWTGAGARYQDTGETVEWIPPPDSGTFPLPEQWQPDTHLRAIFILVTPSFTWLMRVTIGNIKFTFVRFRVNKHIYKMGSGCGSFAKVWQNSCFQYHRYTVQIQSLTKFILNICLLPTNYIEKTKIKKKRTGKARLKFLFKENKWANPGLFSVYFHPSHITIQLQIEKA